MLLGCVALLGDEEDYCFQEDDPPLWVGMRWMRVANVSAARMIQEEGNLEGQKYPRARKWMGFATGLGVVTGFAPALAAFLGSTAAFLGADVVLGSAFSGFAFLSEAVTWGSLGALVTGWGWV